MRVAGITLAVWAVASLMPTSAQETVETPVPILTLKMRKEIAVRGQGAAPLWLPVRCDSDGNLYAQIDTTPAGDPWIHTTRISRDGEIRATFSVEMATGFRKEHVSDSALDLRGNFYILTGKKVAGEDRLFILEFRPDGTLASSIELDTLFVPLKLVALPNNDFLVSGMTWRRNLKDPAREAFTATVDRSGRVHRLSLVDDVQLKEPATDKSEGEEHPETSFRRAVSGGAGLLADDGSIYLLRRTNNPFVYVLDPQGNVQRRLDLKIPRQGYRLITVQVAGGRIAVLFEVDPNKPPESPDAPRRFISLYDSQTGERVLDYLVPSELSGALACYTPNAFVFLGPNKDQQLAIKEAVPY